MTVGLVLESVTPWSTAAITAMPVNLEVDYLLPNGILITMTCCRDDTLYQIKEDLWTLALTRELSYKLKTAKDYIFVARTLSGIEELYDEKKRLCDVHLFVPVLKLIEPEGNQAEKELAQQISLAIGRPLQELDDVKDSDNEVLETRCSFFKTVQQIVEERHIDDIDQYALSRDSVLNDEFVIPDSLFAPEIPIDIWLIPDQLNPDLESSSLEGRQKLRPTMSLGLDEQIMRKPSSSSIASSRSRDGTPAIDGLKIPLDVNIFIETPLNLVQRVLIKGQNQDRLSANLSIFAETEYLIKMAGNQLFLIEELPLCKFYHIIDCYRSRTKPILELVHKTIAYKHVNACAWSLIQPNFVKVHERKMQDRLQTRALPTSSMASIDVEERELSSYAQENWFRVKIISAGYINISDVDEIYVKVALYHGQEMMATKDTNRRPPSNPRWDDEVLTFDDLYIPDLPRATQICFSLCSIRRRKMKEEHCAIAWVNLRLFDRNGRLLDRQMHLNLWPFPCRFDGFVNPLGHVGSNPNWESSRLEIEFEQFGHDVLFPAMELIDEYVAALMKIKKRQAPHDLPKSLDEITTQDRDFINRLLKLNHNATELSDAEKEKVWKLRLYCQLVPEFLPRLLDSVKWSHRSYVAQTYKLLEDWPCVSADTALELLGAKYPDANVHKFAVLCLEKALDDDKLALYLMPLIQVLRYEAFNDNDVTQFLLRRALRNKRIGHKMFWLLRAELVIAPDGVNTRFTLLLEAYCRGCGPYLSSLLRQVEATTILERMSRQVKERRDELYDELTVQSRYLSNLESPLDSSHQLASIALNECRALTSAKRPLWLVWQNNDPLANRLPDMGTYEIIFKEGDDLRQDMLTLHVMRIMDFIWKKEGLDFLLNLYNCLPMGKNIGMIQVVKRSKTFGEIGIVTKSAIRNWLKDHNKGTQAFESAVERFTLSCAGYTVATFVLGIADRHPDNIMVTQDGRVFHIDFGHFLGHYKKKLGITRERVPFILTDEILNVITYGVAANDANKTMHFRRFRDKCERAYLALHRHSRLFVTLFTMMLCMGIPELQRQEDIDFLRRTLSADKKNESEALDYFNKQFDLAHKDRYTVKMNSVVHQFFQHNKRTE